MNTLFGICAVLGGTVLVCQFVLTLFGLGHAHDFVDHIPGDVGDVGHAGGDDGHAQQEHGSNWFFGIITFRTVVAALTFFGLAGLAMESGGAATGPTLIVALGSGVAAMYGVHSMMQFLAGMRADGTVRIDRAVGQTGTVYVTIPARRGGAGKIQMNLQNRTMEFPALTASDELPPGATIKVVNVVGPDTVEVERV